jgi:hypothetical protein
MGMGAHLYPVAGVDVLTGINFLCGHGYRLVVPSGYVPVAISVIKDSITSWYTWPRCPTSVSAFLHEETSVSAKTQVAYSFDVHISHIITYITTTLLTLDLKRYKAIDSLVSFKKKNF